MKSAGKRLTGIFLIISITLTADAVTPSALAAEAQEQPKKNFIKWVDFNVPCAAMKKAISLDIASQDKDVKLNFIEMLAYIAARNGNDFSRYKDAQLEELAEKLRSGKTMAELSPEEKNAVSHRGKALKIFEMKLREYNADK